LYGSGFPKSHDISKAIDKAAGAEREVVGVKETGKDIPSGKGTMQLSKNTYEKEGKTVFNITAPATEPAKQWNGWGTALKPAWEPIVLAMKPLDGTFAENALKHGVAGLNIDGGRIKGLPWKWGTMTNIKGGGYGSKRPSDGHVAAKNIESNPKGRWPANLILDEDTAVMLDEQSGNVGGKWGKQGKNQPKENKSQVPPSTNEQMIDNEKFIGDSGGASRFFYIAKPSRSDRGNRDDVEMPLFDAVEKGFNNNHPTVKPTLLIQRLIELYMYLVKLTATPTGGIILDPFGGSGTTAVTAKQLGRKCIIIEIESKYLDITIERLRQGVLL
jgi:site-specific DNA-methyltransferase (adenine-specific)